MKNFLKKLIAVIFVPCLVLTGCVVNNTTYVYTIDGNKLVANQFQMKETSSEGLVGCLIELQIWCDDTFRQERQ